MFKKFTFLIFVIFFTRVVYSQDIYITGVVKNIETTTLLQGATISLQSKTDTTYIISTLSDSAGVYRFSNIRPDSFSFVY